MSISSYFKHSIKSFKTKLNHNICTTFQVVAWWIIFAHITMSVITGTLLSIIRLTSRKHNSIAFIAICEGRVELFYSYDYFHLGGFSRNWGYQSCNNENLYFYFTCNLGRILNWLIWSNVPDIYFLFRIAWVMKSQTNSIMSLLTSGSLKERKR